jgi:la-related protein 6
LLQVRILRPGNPIPADVRPFVNKHPEMTAKVCALIEFERTESAIKSVKLLNAEEEDKMKVSFFAATFFVDRQHVDRHNVDF